MFPIKMIEYKQKTALEVKEQLQQAGISVRGKTVLDVGFGLGFNGKMMAASGATVFGVERDADAYNWAIQEKTMLRDNNFHGSLQDMPKNAAAPAFDLATVFLWNMDRADYDAVLSALSKTIAPGGTVVIGIHDEIYMSDPYGVAVPPHAKRYFGQIKAWRCPDMLNRYLLICTNPKLE